MESDEPHPDATPKRTWREIAKDMTHETNQFRVHALSQELAEAFKQEMKERKEVNH